MSTSPLLFSAYKTRIATFLHSFLAEKKHEFSQVNGWGSDVLDQLSLFVSEGKMLRGSFILFLCESYTGTISPDALRAAAAMELFHSFLLIHDDIMDHDLTRRGHHTIFAQYQLRGEQEQLSDPRHFGESMGMCVGDICSMLGFHALSTIEDSSLRERILPLYTRELMAVGLAQMQDVYSGYTHRLVSEQEIEHVYVYKTGRYTFSLPFMVGAILSGTSEATLHNLDTLGESLGILFQLTDDWLSLFGSEAVTGKPEGSDIRENKKTLYRLYLFHHATTDQRERLEDIFGTHDLRPEQIAYVRSLLHEHSIQSMIDQKKRHLQKTATDILSTLDLPTSYQKHLLDLIQSLSERTM